MATKFILGMRDAFFNALYEIAKKDRKVVLISADNGAPTLDKFASDLKNQFFTVGIAEQQMIGMAAGMATEGYKVYTYAIAPFVTTRVHEQNKIDICAMNLPIVNLGIGAGYAYDVMGPSHHTVEDISIMRVLPNMTIYSPADGVCAQALAGVSYQSYSPMYIRFDRAGVENIYGDDFNVQKGFHQISNGNHLCILTTGRMVHEAIKVAQELNNFGIQASVIDLFCIKPLPSGLVEKLSTFPKIVTYEEHLLAGGLGSLILEELSDAGVYRPTLRIGQKDRFVFDNGGRQCIWDKYGLDAESVVKNIKSWMAVDQPHQESVLR